MDALPSSGFAPAPAGGQLAPMAWVAVARRRLAAQRWPIGVAALVMLGGLLRLLAARGELCLDEIWTLDLLAPINSVGQVFLDISHDNNHILNSLYLYLLGPEASPLLQRGLAILCGMATIPMAGLVARRNGRPAAIAAMLLFAFSYPLLHYGSEARGYAGWIFFSLLALACLERQLARRDRASWLGLGAAVGLGFLAHLDMAETAFALAAWCFWVRWQASGSLVRGTLQTLHIFLPAMLATAAVAACWVIGWERHGITLGGHFPFTAAGFVEGYGGLLRWTIGLADLVPAWSGLVGAIILFLAAAYSWRKREDYAASLYFIGLIFLPAVIFVAGLPNTEFPRHFLPSGAIFLLFLADLFGNNWSRGGARKTVAATLLALIVIGNLACAVVFFAYGRGQYAEAVAEMGRAGPFTYTGTEQFRTPMLVEFFSRKLGLTAVFVKAGDGCRVPPDWLLVENPDALPPGELSLGDADCGLRFVQKDVFPVWGLSGSTWVLFHRSL